MTLEAIRYRAGSLQILNQLLLPHQTAYEELRSVQDAFEAIKCMKVRSPFLSFLSLATPPPPPSPIPLSPTCQPPPPVPTACAFIAVVHVISFFFFIGSFCVARRCPPCSRCCWPVFLFWMHLQHSSLPHPTTVLYAQPSHYHVQVRQTRHLHTVTHPWNSICPLPLISVGEIIDELLMTFARVFCSRSAPPAHFSLHP